METAWSNNQMKVRKTRTLSENVSPLKIELDDRRGRYSQSTIMSPRFQPFAENIDVGSPIKRYFGGSPLSGKMAVAGEVFTSPPFGSSKYKSTKAQQFSGNSSFGSRGRLSLSPLSSIENLEIPPRRSPTMYGTPVKVDEEVLVMDDIRVKPSSGGKSGRSSSSSSGKGSSSSSSSTSKRARKTEICKAWEESGNCRYSSECQFAQGQEELHPSCLSMKRRSEGQKSTIRPGYVWTPNPRVRVTHPNHAEAHFELVVTEYNEALANWSPMDDGIEVVLPNGSNEPPSREEFDAYIYSLLDGGPSTGKKRLSAFATLLEEGQSSF